MRKELAHKIIATNNLIPGKISRKILNAIINEETLNCEDLPLGVSVEQIDRLRKQYSKKIAELSLNTQSPRYLPFYYIIKDRFPNFFWQSEDISGGQNIYIHAPRVHNLRPSLLSLLLNRVSEEKDTLLHRKYHCVDKLPHSIIIFFDELMERSRAYYPPEKEMLEIIDLLSRALAGDKLTVFIPICPDYAIEYTDNKKCPVRFTFHDLGCGNGIIAQWILSAIKNLATFLEKCKISAEIVVAMADFEAFSEENLKTFNITKEEFFRRAHLSTQAFKKACPVQARVIRFTELCDEEKWRAYMKYIHEKFSKSDYGLSGINKNILLDIIAKRKQLYNRWYGEKAFLEDYINIALDQGMMYAAMGMVLNEHYTNCMVFAADNKVMRHFYSFSKRMPTLYLNKEYS